MTSARPFFVAVFFIVMIVHGLADVTLRKSYAIRNNRATWSEARTLCENENMSLATIMNSEEQGLLRTAITTSRANKSILELVINPLKYWIAATNVGCINGQFCWFGNSSAPITYSDWGVLNPILQIFNGEKCVKLWTQEAKWYEVNCSDKLAYVCEFYS